MKAGFKSFLCVVVLILMFFPVVQHGTKIFRVKPLDGDFTLHPRPAFTWSSWMKGTFQENFDRYIEDHIGFRPFFVRLHNQLDFSLFRKANAEGILVGRRNILHEYDYVRAWLGLDFIGKATIDKKLARFRFLQDHLKEKLNIDLILVLEPSKARTYPETLPKRFLQQPQHLSNYEYISQQARALNLNLLDLNALFLKIKDTIDYPLFPPYGIHWGDYTMPFVADTLLHFIEHLRGIKLPAYQTRFFLREFPSEIDYDAGRTLNLLFRLPHPTMLYPEFIFSDTASGTKPMVLAVADSYYWNFFNTRIPRYLFANEAFWYFNAKVYPDFYFGEKWTKDLNLQEEIEKQDVILLCITERFLHKLGWNFIDQVYELYSPQFTGDIIYKYENLIRLDDQWFNNILEKSRKTGKSLEESIHQEARYQAWVQEPEIFLTWYGMDHYRKVISDDPQWSATIQEKARLQQTPFEEQLEKDAEYIFQMEHPEIFRLHQTIRRYTKAIVSDSAWLELIREKARNFLLPVEEMIRIDAEYVARMELSRLTNREERIRYYEDAIRSDPTWLEHVRQKALQRGKTLDEMIHEDAIYMVDQEQQ